MPIAEVKLPARLLSVGLLMVLCGCSMATQRTGSPEPSREGPAPLSRSPWSVELPGPGSSQIVGMATQAGDILAIGSFSGETTVGSQRLVSSGEEDVLVIRLTQDRQVRWVKHWGGSGDDRGEAIKAGEDGSLLVMGNLTGEVDFDGAMAPGRSGMDCFIAKLAGADGHVLWARRFGGEGNAACRSAAFDLMGDVLVTGRFVGTVDLGFGAQRSAGENDLFLMKLAGPDGTPRWAHPFGGAGDDVGRDVAVDSTGTLFLTGHFSSGVEPSVGAMELGTIRLTSAGDSDAFLAAFSGEGRCLWARAIGGPNFDIVKTVVPAADGSLFLTGLFQGEVTRQPGQLLFSAGGFEGIVARYSAHGEQLWLHRYPTLTSGHAIALLPTRELAMAGHFTAVLDLGAGGKLQSEGKNDVFVALLGTEGDVRWAHRLGGPGQDYGYAVTAVAGGVAVGGMLGQAPPEAGGEAPSHGYITWLPVH